MDCENFHKKLADYENLSVKDRAELLEHTEQCSSCAEEWSDYNKMLETVRSLPELKAPDDFIAKLNERIDKEKPEREKAPGVWVHLKQHGYRYSAAAACVMLAVVIGVNSAEYIEKTRGSDSDLPVNISDLATDKPGNTSAPKQSAAPSASPAASEKPAQPTANPAASNKTSAPKATQKPVATAIPSSMQKQKTPAAPTLSPKATTAPESGNNTASSVQSHNEPAAEEPQTFSAGTTSAPQSTEDSSGTPASDNTAESNDIMVASAGQNGENEPSLQSVLDPSQYSLPEDNSVGSSSGGSGGSGYSRSTDTANSIEVSSANADRAREIISEYSIANDGDCYSVSKDRMEEFLEAMNSAGIEYADNCVEMGADTVTFRLIIS